jgi:hypothetical protein
VTRRVSDPLPVASLQRLSPFVRGTMPRSTDSAKLLKFMTKDIVPLRREETELWSFRCKCLARAESPPWPRSISGWPASVITARNYGEASIPLLASPRGGVAASSKNFSRSHRSRRSRGGVPFPAVGTPPRPRGRSASPPRGDARRGIPSARLQFLERGLSRSRNFRCGLKPAATYLIDRSRLQVTAKG